MVEVVRWNENAMLINPANPRITVLNRMHNNNRREGVPMSNQNIETTKKGYAAFNAGDLEAALSVFDDSVEWTIPGDSVIGGIHRSKRELTELMAQLAQKTTNVDTKRFLA